MSVELAEYIAAKNRHKTKGRSPMSSIQEQLQKKILILDGAMGTMIQNANLTAEDFGGEEFDGCNEYLNITSPETIQAIHEQYLEAGADIIETNTFGGTSIVLDEYNLGHLAYEINKKGAELAVAAAKSIQQKSGLALLPVVSVRQQKHCL